jgi:hypothetical protein
MLEVTLIKMFCRVPWDVLGHPYGLKHPSWQHYYELYENNDIDVNFVKKKNTIKKCEEGDRGLRILDTTSRYYSLLYTKVDNPRTSNKHFKRKDEKSWREALIL